MIIIALAALVLLYAFYSPPKSESDIRWEYGLENILCIGDSLTSGAYFGSDSGGMGIQETYPYYLERMLNTRVVNGGAGGTSPSDWYKSFADNHDYSEFDSVIIWLGTNYAPTNTLSEDVIPYSSPEDYADTETGYYCRIIDRVRQENPDCFIVLLNIFASKSDVEEANIAIEEIAKHYGLPVVDVSDMGSEKHPEYHAGISNPHLGKAGNIYVASRIVDEVNAYFDANPLRSEFGIHEAG